MSAAKEPDLVARLIARPHSHEALTALYDQLGEQPQRYASTLEQAALSCADPAAASHYLTEAARTTLDALADVPETCRLLGRAVELDPKNTRAASLLGRMATTQLKRADYGGLLRRRAKTLEELARRDATWAWLAADAWELVGRGICASGGPAEDAMSAMTRALEVVRRAFRGSGSPEAESHGDAYSERVPRGESMRRDTIRTPNPASALVARAAPVEDSDAEPTLPRAPAERQETLPPDDERPTQTDLRVDTPGGATIRSPRPPSGPAATDSPGSGPDRLIGLFEALGEVAAKATLEEAARCLADIVRRKLAARAVLVHVFAPTTAEYVIMAASGAYDRALLGTRVPSTDTELSESASSSSALVVDAGPRGRLAGERWVTLEPKRCVLVAPACLDGRPYGAVEVCDPLDRGRFDASDQDALTYVGERWAELVAEREPY